MTALTRRLALGFGAAAFAHVLFQGPFGAILHAAGLIPEPVLSLEPVPPYAVPATVNNMFWDGLWGMLYGALEPRLTARIGRAGGGLMLGFASLLVFWFVVLPLKGSGIAALTGGEVAVDLAFDAAFGLGTAFLYWTGLRLKRKPLRS